MLRRNVPYYSNVNVPVMAKLPLLRWGGGGIVWAHEALTGHLTECPEKGERKNNNNRGEQEENRLRLDSAEGRSITHDKLGWDTGVCGVGNKKNLYSTNFP